MAWGIVSQQVKSIRLLGELCLGGTASGHRLAWSTALCHGAGQRLSGSSSAVCAMILIFVCSSLE